MSECFKIKDGGDGEEFSLPSYSTPGRILVEVLDISDGKSGSTTYPYKYETEVHDFDGDTGVFWINEVTGFEYWFDEYIDFKEVGWYVIEGVSGEYIRGDGWTTDDDESWDYSLIRKATDEEIAAECLIGPANGRPKRARRGA